MLHHIHRLIRLNKVPSALLRFQPAKVSPSPICRFLLIGAREKSFVFILKSFVKIGITKTFCNINKMFSSVNKTYGCCSKIFGCSNKNFIGRRNLSDTEFVRHGSSPTNSGVVRLGFVGQPPCRTTSVSDDFLHLKGFATTGALPYASLSLRFATKMNTENTKC